MTLGRFYEPGGQDTNIELRWFRSALELSVLAGGVSFNACSETKCRSLRKASFLKTTLRIFSVRQEIDLAASSGEGHLTK